MELTYYIQLLITNSKQKAYNLIITPFLSAMQSRTGEISQVPILPILKPITPVNVHLKGRTCTSSALVLKTKGSTIFRQ